MAGSTSVAVRRFGVAIDEGGDRGAGPGAELEHFALQVGPADRPWEHDAARNARHGRLRHPACSAAGMIGMVT